MAEVARAVVIRLATAAAGFSIVEDAHARIEEAADSGLVAIVGARVCDFDDRPLFNLVRAKDAELDANDRLNI